MVEIIGYIAGFLAMTSFCSSRASLSSCAAHGGDGGDMFSSLGLAGSTGAADGGTFSTLGSAGAR